MVRGKRQSMLYPGGFRALAAIVALVAVALPGGLLASSPAARAKSPCSVSLRDAPDYRAVPLPPGQVVDYVHYWITKRYVSWDSPGWPNQGSFSFPSCHPRRLLLIGDSIPFSFGVPMLDGENRYGVELANASILGCGFVKRGDFYNLDEVWQPVTACPDAPIPWGRDADAFRADAVIVEEGYRDEFNYRWNGRIVHLGQPAFDAYVRSQIERYVQILGNGGKRPIVLMTVPYDHSRMLNGRLAPVASPSRHRIINQLIESVASKHARQVAVFDTDSIISPGNHYDDYVNGKQCRLVDRIHVTVYCSMLMQPKLFDAALRLIARFSRAGGR